MPVDYTLYLVTDSTRPILGSRSLEEVVRQAIDGGVSIVQYRDKTSDTAELIRMGKLLHSITSNARIPLLINDRVDVAIAVDAEGVHLGQDDFDISLARKLLGKSAIIGITCSTPEEARIAAEKGASYLGIGTVFATPTKEDTKSTIGPQGVKAILQGLSKTRTSVKAVAIGGIASANVQGVMYQSGSVSSKGLDGVAVVSAIMAADDPKAAATKLRTLIGTPPIFAPTTLERRVRSIEQILERVKELVTEIGDENPLCHNMTNLVVQNFAANVALAIGASPIMANYGEEAKDLARLGGSLIINMGTVTPDGISNYLLAVEAYNSHGGPVLFDPVGAGATKIRRDAVKSLLNGGYFDVIKGNENEIRTLLGESDQQQKGVDSNSSTTSATSKAQITEKLADKQRNVVIMTGATDYLSDGERTYSIKNGSPYLGKITGSGCVLGTTIAAYTSIYKQDKLLAAIAAMLVFEIAAEQAAGRPDVKGPGTFVPAFLDELHNITESPSTGNWDWLKAAQVEAINI